jgi:hypothetical protein
MAIVIGLSKDTKLHWTLNIVLNIKFAYSSFGHSSYESFIV